MPAGGGIVLTTYPTQMDPMPARHAAECVSSIQNVCDGDSMFVIPMAGPGSRFKAWGAQYQLSIANTIVFDLAIKSFERYFSTDLFCLSCVI